MPVAVAITFFVTFILTAIITALAVFLVMWLMFVKRDKASTSGQKKGRITDVVSTSNPAYNSRPVDYHKPSHLHSHQSKPPVEYNTPAHENGHSEHPKRRLPPQAPPKIPPVRPLVPPKPT